VELEEKNVLGVLLDKRRSSRFKTGTCFDGSVITPNHFLLNVSSYRDDRYVGSDNAAKKTNYDKRKSFFRSEGFRIISENIW
jgi:hypothetical protein